MKPSLLNYMKRTWSSYAEMQVRLVLFPLPPTPAKNTMYMPDAFTSKSFDLAFNRPKEFIAIDVKPSRWGPAVLALVKLQQLVHWDAKLTGYLTVPHATCCATVSFYVVFRGADGLEYAGDAQLDSLQLASRSCHPGSHFAVPMAPYLTTMLQYAQAPEAARKMGEERPGQRYYDHYSDKKERIQIQYATPEEAAALFPQCDFYKNDWIDRYVGTCVMDPKASYFNVAGGLGEWSRPYMRQLRHNLLRKEFHSEIQGAVEIFGNAGKKDGGSSDQRRTANGGEAAGELRQEGRGNHSSRSRIITH